MSRHQNPPDSMGCRQNHRHPQMSVSQKSNSPSAQPSLRRRRSAQPTAGGGAKGEEAAVSLAPVTAAINHQLMAPITPSRSSTGKQTSRHHPSHPRVTDQEWSDARHVLSRVIWGRWANQRRNHDPLTAEEGVPTQPPVVPPNAMLSLLRLPLPAILIVPIVIVPRRQSPSAS